MSWDWRWGLCHAVDGDGQFCPLQIDHKGSHVDIAYTRTHTPSQHRGRFPVRNSATPMLRVPEARWTLVATSPQTLQSSGVQDPAARRAPGSVLVSTGTPAAPSLELAKARAEREPRCLNSLAGKAEEAGARHAEGRRRRDAELEQRRRDLERREAGFERPGELGASMGASLGSSLATGCMRGCYALTALLAALTVLSVIAVARAAPRNR